MLELPEENAQTAIAQSARSPVAVHQVVHSCATGPMTSDRMKVKVVNSGSATIRHQCGALRLDSGQVALFPPNHWYAREPADPVVTTTAYIDSDLVRGQVRWIPASSAPALLLSRDEKRSNPIVVDLPPQALPRLNAIFRLLLRSQKDYASPLHKLGLTVELLNVLTHPAIPHTPSNGILHHAVWLLLEHLDRPWTIEDLAAAVSVSKSQLSRLFRAHLLMSPAEFLRTERAHRMAEQLLANSDSIEAIARQVGWHNSSHASRAFRHINGVSPQHYRQAHGSPQVQKRSYNGSDRPQRT